MSWYCDKYSGTLVGVGVVGVIAELFKYFEHNSAERVIKLALVVCVIPVCRWLMGYDLFVPERGPLLLIQIATMVLLGCAIWRTSERGKEDD